MQSALCDAFHKIIHNRKPFNILCASPANYNSKNNNKKGCKENDLTTDGLRVRFSFGASENRIRELHAITLPSSIWSWRIGIYIGVEANQLMRIA